MFNRGYLNAKRTIEVWHRTHGHREVIKEKQKLVHRVDLYRAAPPNCASVGTEGACRGRDPETRSHSRGGRSRIQQAHWLRRGAHACRLRALRSDLIDPSIAVHHGRMVKRTGDGSIIEFRSVVDAVRCAIEVQNGMVERNAGLPPERRIEFRMGIHLGDVVEESDGDLMGDGVNIAARLEDIAKPGVINGYSTLSGR